MCTAGNLVLAAKFLVNRYLRPYKYIQSIHKRMVRFQSTFLLKPHHSFMYTCISIPITWLLLTPLVSLHMPFHVCISITQNDVERHTLKPNPRKIWDSYTPYKVWGNGTKTWNLLLLRNVHMRTCWWWIMVLCILREHAFNAFQNIRRVYVGLS